jgi:glycosyltransferase involved in cell wall biosynthesis
VPDPSFRVTVSLGPGSYTEDLVQQLRSRGVLGRVLRAWPRLVAEDVRPGDDRLQTTREIAFYPPLVRATWAVWRRLPRLRRHQTPQVPLNSLYDRIASRLLGHPDLFLGWSQVSLRSLKRAKALGAAAVLEHPMLHARVWQETMTDEYAQHAPDCDLHHSLFPAGMVDRMLREYDVADFIVVPSEAAVQSFTRYGLPRKKLVKIPLGVDPARLSPGDRTPGSPFQVLYVGRLELLKGVHYLMQAWSGLALEGASLRLVGPVLPEIRPWLDRHANQSVEVAGEVPHSELARYYRSADLVVFPSLNDGFGLVILEAMSCGCPVIATHTSGGPDIITDGVDGFVVAPRDPAAIAERLAWGYGHREELSPMGARARAKIVSGFSLDRYGERLVDAYGRIYAERARPR